MTDYQERILSEERGVQQLLDEALTDTEYQENIEDVRYSEELNRREEEEVIREYWGEVIQDEH